MGRELKRVPNDFKWPIGQLWKGYVCPYTAQECKSCGGTGLNQETKKIRDEWYSFEDTEYRDLPNGRRYNNKAWQYHLTEIEVDALLKSNRLWDFTRIPINEEQKQVVEEKIEKGGNSWLPFDNGYRPTPKEVNEWAKNGIGHDAYNQWICVEARAKHLGFYGHCVFCEGGEIWHTKEIKDAAENWKSYDPPKGEAFQLWNTTTEGHPMSPVFSSLEELCEYLEIEGVSVFGRNTATKEEWFNMLDDGFVSHKEGNRIFI